MGKKLLVIIIKCGDNWIIIIFFIFTAKYLVIIFAISCAIAVEAGPGGELID